MKKLSLSIKLWILIAIVSISYSGAAAGKEVAAQKIAVIVSQSIRPYIEAVEGLSSEISAEGEEILDVIFLDKFEGKDLVNLSQTLDKKDIDLFIAIGPHAARFVWEDIKAVKAARFYSMVLNPEKALAMLEFAAGIPLNISAKTQVEMIHRGMPSVNRIGIIYDPEYNLDFFGDAYEEAYLKNIRIVSLAVSSRKDIPLVLKNNWNDLDALWLIPDRTVISESIVQYVIKEALFNGVPVIGYNRFFYESGAALAFIFDYSEIGRQCAKEALKLLSEREVKKSEPVFNVWVNERVMNRLGMETGSKYHPPVGFGP